MQAEERGLSPPPSSERRAGMPADQEGGARFRRVAAPPLQARGGQGCPRTKRVAHAGRGAAAFPSTSKREAGRDARGPRGWRVLSAGGGFPPASERRAGMPADQEGGACFRRAEASPCKREAGRDARAPTVRHRAPDAGFTAAVAPLPLLGRRTRCAGGCFRRLRTRRGTTARVRRHATTPPRRAPRLPRTWG